MAGKKQGLENSHLSRRQKQDMAMANHLAGMSKPRAMLAAGYSEHYSDEKSHRFFERPEIKSRMTVALEKAKPTIVDLAAEQLVASLEAEKTDSADYDVRLRAANRIVEIFGFIQGKTEIAHVPAPPIEIHFHLDTPVEKREVVDVTPGPVTKPFVLSLKR